MSPPYPGLGAPPRSARVWLARGLLACALSAWASCGAAEEVRGGEAHAEESADPEVARLLQQGSALLAQSAITLGGSEIDVAAVRGAAAAFDEALRLAPGSASAHLQRGVAALRLMDWERAVAEFEQARELAPGLAPAHAHLGAALAVTGRLEEAVASFARAVALDPAMEEAHARLGEAALELGEWSRAREAFEAALRLREENLDAWWGLAQCLRHLGLGAEADQALARRAELAARLREAVPKPSVARQAALPAFEAGLAHMRAGRPEEARRAFEQAVLSDASLAAAHANLGLLAERAGDPETAFASYLRAAAANPALELPRLRLAELYRQRGEEPRARAELEALLEHHPDHTGARELLLTLRR